MKSAPPTVPHLCEVLQQAVQHSTNKHYTSSDGFIKRGELANFLEKLQFFFQTFLPISDPEFCAALG